MTTLECVRQARSPHDALLAIAEALDRIEAKIGDAQPTDLWGSWDAADTDYAERDHSSVHEAYVKARASEEEIRAVRVQLDVVPDGDDRRALEARLKLLTDEGASIVPADPGERVQTFETDTDVIVNIPAPDSQRAFDRRRFVTEHKLWEFLSTSALTPKEFTDAFVQGGPMWLYCGDRDAVMTMPERWRRWMINDIEVDSPGQAAEVARDILKDTSAGEPETILGRMYG